MTIRHTDTNDTLYQPLTTKPKVELIPKQDHEPTKRPSDRNNAAREQKKPELDEEIEVVLPPDGGWGWVVVVASFMCNMIVDGIIFSFGPFLPIIADDFAVSKSQVTLVGSLMSGFYLIAGPFASALANRYGFRLVTMAGSILGALAFVLSYFANSIPMLCVTYGIIGGIGFGLIFAPSVIIVGFYFERWRALATGIAVCGSGIGTFVLAPLSEMLISSLGWRNAFLVQGMIVLSCFFYGILFRPIKSTKIKKNNGTNELVMDPLKLPTITKLKMEEALRNMEHERTFVFRDSNKLSEVYHTISVPSRHFCEHSKEKSYSIPSLIVYDQLNNEDNNYVKPPPLANRPLYRDDIFFNASLKRLPQYLSKTSIEYNLSVTRIPSKADIEASKVTLCDEDAKKALAAMLDISLLKSPSFLIMAVGGFFTMMGFYVPFMYLEGRASGIMSKQMSILLISSIGISNTVGRVLCGLLSSFPGVNALLVTNIAMTIGGISTIMSGVSLTTEFQFFYTVIFGLAISCFASLRSIIVVDLLGLEKLTNAFGLLLLFQGIAAIIGAPLAGFFMDLMGSYDATFYLSGTMILLSAIMCYPLPWVKEWENRRTQE